jgi:hypothetical protein
MVIHDPSGARASHPFPCGARFGTRAIGFVATTSSGLRVLQRLEPIAHMLRGILVLTVVAGVAERWAKDQSDSRDSDFASSGINHFKQDSRGSDPSAVETPVIIGVHI